MATYPLVVQVTSVTATSITCRVTGSSASYKDFSYSLDGGETYYSLPNQTGKTITHTIAGLSPNTSYSIKYNATVVSTGIRVGSNIATASTAGPATIASANDIYLDTSPAVIKFGVYIEDKDCCYTVNIKKTDGTLLFTKNVDPMPVGTNEIYISLSSAEQTALLSEFSSAKTLDVQIEFHTYLDSARTNELGYAMIQIKFRTSESNSAPIISSVTHQDTKYASVTGNSEVLIAGKSILQVKVNASARSSSAIRSYSVTIGDRSATSTSSTVNVGAVNSTGNLTMTITVTDSRGYSKKQTKVVKVLPYENPKITSTSIRRQNEIGALIELDFSGTMSEIKADGSTNTNYISMAKVTIFRYDSDGNRVSQDIDVTEDVTASGTMFSFSTDELTELDPELSYYVNIAVRDALGQATEAVVYYITLPQGVPLLCMRRRDRNYDFPRVGINNKSPAAALDVNGNIIMNGVFVQGYVGTVAILGDFNDYMRGGIYYFQGGGDVGNSPLNGNYYGILEVLTPGPLNGSDFFVIQRFTSYTKQVVTRVYSYNASTDSYAWGSWS